ncbi:TPA: PLP-dependent aminotransferase family protein [Elizabethkingia anophelis]|uniref:PLP-dependent aminotransferase family protein n=1 Tax=Elizabethkingia anophelis R26 TaxID=1246994 RepID=A0ABN5BZM8_9FLAO|nr:PLP-dependent aminotransferase family protein [Elizabethkingia anophelis]ATC36337.1 PLP-dependent aminotransferase family protein [Elizabethkingia anophelis R26]ATC40014.1 PLP-dependent aminotransferase family protein [Elizabethkingia anophelis Ag1]ATC43693.1 PLP-dependent aminotransferase family protein [Elizabethkingia anophelis]ATC47369.1 PLP-dependent aminotransferase family protein [Elizabethkingia anophelis]ELR80982.1 transcriptional regulator, gntr family with aminotransferase domain
MLRPWKLEIQLDHQSDKAIYLQIADAIIEDIQSGRLKQGTALPGSRKLAQDLKVNRNTVVEALNVLLNEEWLVSKERRGTFVSDILPALSKTVRPKHDSVIEKIEKSIFRINFDDGHPDSKIAPVAELARAYRQIFSRKGKWQMMGYGDEFGDVEFRKAIVQMANHQRGMQASEHEVCITRGSQMAMYLTAHSLFEKEDYVIVEEPGYKPAWKAFESAGARILPVNVDKDGLITDEVLIHLRSGKKIRAIYTTPHHQYPTTVTLSLQRRLELIHLSNKFGFSIIEDDYDNEFHFGYRPVLPLSSYTELKNYVYIGTMSKVVAPALRIGYLISNNKELLERVGTLRKIIDVQGDTIMEQAVLQLINDGTIKRHLKKATHFYRAKRDFAAELLRKHLKSKADYHIPEGGLAFWIMPKKQIDWDTVSEVLKKKGIRIVALDHYQKELHDRGIRLSYGAVSEEQLEEGIKELAKLL